MSEDQERPSRIQSPSYPAYPLSVAIDVVAKIEQRYRSSKVDRLDAVKLLGFSGVTGPSNMALAALAQYGLIARQGKGEFRVTDLARAILYPDDKAEKAKALRTAALSPKLFRSLRERYPDVPVPPEEGVYTYLNRNGFNPTAVRPAAKAFLQTMAFIQELGDDESSGGVGSTGQDGIGPADDPPPSQQATEAPISMDHQLVPVQRAAPSPPAPIPEEPTPNGGTDLRYKLPRGVTVQIRSPDALGEAELTKLVALLTAQRDALKED